MVIEDSEWVKRFLERDERAIKDFYQLYKKPFTEMLKKYRLDHETIKDIYQESVLAFFNSILEKRYNPDLSSVKTFLFGIGKFKSLDRIKKNKNELIKELEIERKVYIPEELVLTTQQHKLQSKFGKLGPKCRQVLNLFYYRGLSNLDIVELGYYPNENTVKSQKSRCLRQLRELVKS